MFMNLNSKEIGITPEGWKIKVVTNEMSGKVTYMGYFELGVNKAPAMLASDNLEDLKDKISRSKYNKKKFMNLM